MISHKHKCIFIHIVKTGGTSVEQLLIKNQLWHKPQKHWTASRAKKGYSEWWDAYYKFSIVRNPYDRLYSAYKFFMYPCSFKIFIKYRPLPPCTARRKPQLGGSILLKNKYSEESCRAYCTRYACGDDPIFKPCIDSITSPEGCVLIDRILRFENLNAEWFDLANDIDLPTKLPHVIPFGNGTRNKRSNYIKHYDDETREAVAKDFAKDIEYFGYKFEQ